MRGNAHRTHTIGCQPEGFSLPDWSTIRQQPRLAATFEAARSMHRLDLFGGRGSTLIAAEQTKRRAFLMELDPLYADVIVQRWVNHTGRKAERK